MEKKKKIVFAILAVCIVCLVLGIAYYMLKDTCLELLELLKLHDKQALMDYLNSKDEVSGMISIFFLSVLQVITIFFPAMFIQFVSGLIYGWWKAFIACHLGFVVGNLLVFRFARHFHKFVQNNLNFDSKSNWILDKINSTKPEFVFALTYMIPGIPNGIVPYIAAKSDIRFTKYAMTVALACMMSILSNCWIGHFLIRGEYIFVVLSFTFQISMIGLVIWKKEWFLKKGKK